QQLEERAPDGRLAAAGFADEPQRLAGCHMEGYAIHGKDLTREAREDPLVDREMLLEVAHLHHGGRGPARLGGQRAAFGIVHSGALPTLSPCQQATQWPGRSSESGG